VTLDKFIPPFVKLIEEEPGDKNNQFSMDDIEKLEQHPISKAENVFVAQRSVEAQVIASEYPSWELSRP
jgi:hypothetical protein